MRNKTESVVVYVVFIIYLQPGSAVQISAYALLEIVIRVFFGVIFRRKHSKRVSLQLGTISIILL
jgi:hypothetical protein